MTRPMGLSALVFGFIGLGLGLAALAEKDDERSWTTEFGVAGGELGPTGRNPYFVLEPGYMLNFEGKEKGEPVELVIRVLDETRTVSGVVTRVVEERESKSGKPVEVSRNFFAISKRTNDVFYFGEEVDIYEGGRVVSHEGAWLAGESGAKYGLAMPGTPLLGARYYQEVAPGKAMDRAEVISVSASLEFASGKYERCLKTEETTPLEPGDREAKYYAPGIGLIKDGPFRLVKHGRASR